MMIFVCVCVRECLVCLCLCAKGVCISASLSLSSDDLRALSLNQGHVDSAAHSSTRLIFS